MSPSLDSPLPATEAEDRSREPRVGDRLGPYYLQQLVGQGGMGRVFRAVHEKLGRTVAIKLMRRSVSHGDGVRRFLREARAVNKARHPHLIEITDIVEAEPGADSYYVMEWLEGRDLHARMTECNGLIPLPEVLRILRDVTEGLGAAHAAGLYHRDLKPENIFLLERDGRRDFAKVIDFGVARDESDAESDMADYIVGTAAYMAPEQAQGQRGDQRSDIYSLGVILYELSVGHLPYSAPTTAETVALHLAGQPERPRSAAPAGVYIPRSLERIILRCMEVEPRARYASMAELWADLARLQARLLLPAWRRLEPGRVARVALPGVLVGGLLLLGWHGRQRLFEQTHVLSDAVQRRVRPVTPAPPAENPDEPLPLQVRVRSSPAGAEVLYNGVALGTTPCVVRLPEGRREIELRRAGYRREHRTVEVRVGAEVSVRLQR